MVIVMAMMVTWKTVSKALVMESKLEVGRPSGKLKCPPKSCKKFILNHVEERADYDLHAEKSEDEDEEEEEEEEGHDGG